MTLGLFYEHDDLDQVDGSDLSGQPIPGITPPFADQFFAQFNQKLELSRRVRERSSSTLNDAVTLDAGVRYTHDQAPK